MPMWGQVYNALGGFGVRGRDCPVANLFVKNSCSVQLRRLSVIRKGGFGFSDKIHLTLIFFYYY